MLSVMDPIELDDLVVFRDDEDPRKFYLLPDQPVIPVDEDGDPEFLFIRYIKDLEDVGDEDAPGAGYVQFRTTLTITPERKTRVVEALKARLEEEKAQGKKPFGVAITSTEPLLASPLWTKGEVSLATFQVSDTGLVRHATEKTPADLAGDLGASFRLDLDADGAEVFWSSFKAYGQQVPILITYELTYKARVSARMTINAKREIIHKQIWHHARPYLLAANAPRYVALAHTGAFNATALATLRTQHPRPVVAMIEPLILRKAVQESMVNNEIEVKIETDQAAGGDEENKVRELMFKVASDVLSDKLIPALFGVDTYPGGSGQDGKTSQLLRLPDGTTPGGDATFNLTLDHQTTIERVVNPNGPIALAMQDADRLASCFRELRLSDGFFKDMRVSVSTAGVNFERDGIDRIHVWLRYDQVDEQHPSRARVRHEFDGAITSETTPLAFRFDLARSAAGGHKRGYEYRTKVYYKQGPPSPPDDGPWLPSADRMLIITPAEVGAIRVDLALTAAKTFESARVSLKHDTQGRTYETALELTPDAARKTWFQYTGAPQASNVSRTPPKYSYQVRYRRSDGEIVLPPRESTSEVLEIGNPFARTLVYTLLPRGSFDGITSIAGELVYDDGPHGYSIRKPFQLQKLTDVCTVEIPALPDGPGEAKWSARIIHTDGRVSDLGTSSGPPGTYTIGGGSALTVQVLPELIDFDADVQLAIVELAYDDPAHGITERKTLTFSKSAKAAQTWIVSRQDATRNTYDVRIRYVAYDRTKNTEVRLDDSDQQVLVLDRAPVT
jgi:hypothetical protein